MKMQTIMRFRTESVSLSVPAVRMVVVAAWVFEDGTTFSHLFHPVIAVMASVRNSYGKRTPSGEYVDDSRLTHSEFLDAGWRFHGQSIELDTLIIDGEFGCLNFASEELGSISNLVYKVAACPWPESEDEVRLAFLVEELTKSLRERTA